MSTAEAVNDDEFLAQLYKGGELLAAGKVDEAKGHLEKAHQLRPKNEKAQNLLGLTYFKLGKFEQAANIYEALVRENPVDPTLRVNLGLVYLKWNLLDKSVKEFETATDLQPDHKKAHNYLGLALAQANDYARAREHFLIAGSESMAEKMAKAMVSAEPPTNMIRATMEMPAVIIPPPPPPAPEPSPAAPRLPHDEPLAPPAASDEPPHMHRTREARPMEMVDPPPDARPSRPSEDAEIEVMSEEDMVPPDDEELPPSPVSAEPRPTFKPPTTPEPLSADWGAQFGIDTPPGAEEMPVLEAQPVIEATVEEVVEVESGLPVAATTEAEAPAWNSSGPVDEALSQQQLPSWVTDIAPTNGNGNGHTHEGPDPTGGWSAVPPSDDVLMQQAGAVDPSVTEPPPPIEEPESAMVVTQGDPYASEPVPIVAPTQMSDEMDFSSANPEDSGNASSVSVDPSLMAETGYSTSAAAETIEMPAVEEPAPAFEATEMTYRPAASFDGEETYVPKGEDPRPDPFAGHGVEMEQVPEVEPPPMPPNVPVVTVDPDEDSLPPSPVSSAPRPGFAPVEVPRLVDLGPSLDYGQSPKMGPFHVGPEGLALSVEGELLSRLSNVVAVVGSVEAAPERRRFRGRASDEPFGEGASQVQRLTGHGVVYLESGGSHFQAIDLDDEGVYLREERCFAFEEVVAFENGKLSGENVTVPLVNLKGHGRVLVRLDGPLKAIAVPPGTPLKVPLARLVGWYGRVSPKVIGFVGQAALELTGDGYALLSRS